MKTKQPGAKAMRPTFDNEAIGAPWSILNCPVCGEDGHMHQRTVEVFQRAEDASIGLHVQVLTETVFVGSEMDGNPSSRRQGLRIKFECESCPDKPHFLTIVQHKGSTLIEWEQQDPPQ